MTFRPRCCTARMPWLACGLAFLALGMRQPAMTGVGLALLELALGAWSGDRR